MRLGLWLTIAGSLGLGGCFDDPAPSTGDGSTGAPPCNEGALGCACGPAGACDESLSCEPSVSLCIDPSCTPGEALCTCVDGGCLTGLVCDEGLCRVPSAGDTTDGRMDSTRGDDGGPDGTPGDDGATTLPAGTTSHTPGETGPLTSDSSDPTDAGGMCAMEATCVDCFGCSVGADAPCEMPYDACANDMGCKSLQACVEGCGPDGACALDCCSAADSGIAAFNVLLSCAGAECPCLGNFQCPG